MRLTASLTNFATITLTLFSTWRVNRESCALTYLFWRAKMANARLTDPVTSHEAADSVSKVTDTQEAILKLLVRPMTDEELLTAYSWASAAGEAPRASGSGIRSRRHELFDRGLVCPVGYSLTASNRKALVWSVA
jgi:hypothetical protein